jgi:hypothetical protein
MPNLPISGLPTASALNGTELLPFVQGGVTTQAIVQDILDANLPLTSSGITLSGDIVPATPRGANLGSSSQPFKEIYLQSGSINIESDIPGGRRATISNADGNVTIQAAGFQLKSGSFIPFEISETARTIVRVPNIPAGDIGAFSIIGNPSGSYQPVTNAGGMIHLTGNDGESSRITNDAYGTNANAVLVGRKARGTASTPLPVQTSDVLTRLSSIGWTGPEYGFTMSSSLTVAPTSIDAVALQNFTTSSFGTAYRFFNVPLNSTTRTLSAQLDTTGLFVSGAFSASLQSGYIWVGDSNNRTTTIPSSSFVTSTQTGSFVTNSQTGSFMTTGSLTGNTFTFTKADSSTFNLIFNTSSFITSAQTGSFYTTGSFGFYGAFCSTASQTNPSPNVSRSMQLETTEISNGVSVVSGSRIRVANPGVYNLQFSAQLEKTTNGADTAYIWFKKNGTNVPRSNTAIDVLKQAGGSGKFVAAWNYIDTLSTNDYIEITWQSADTTMQLAADTASGNFPSIPSVIATLTQVA